MELLVNLLERKNLCFRSFHKLCEDFLDEIAKGDTTNLEQFQRRRQGLIKVLEQLEFEVSHLIKSFDSNPGTLDALMTQEARTKVNRLFREKDSVVTSILDYDLQILSYIDRIKDETVQKLQSVQTGKKGIGAYKSPLESVELAESNKAFDREA